MATIPPPARVRDLGEYQRQVRSPLARLRGTIRTYVAVEGALLLVVLVALWFWAGFALDYGFFKLFGVDWVQEWPWAVRLVLLVLVAGGVLAAVFLSVFGRLFRDFRDSSLALVLERRFPGLLGDRLITAVELSDLREAEKQGYSPAMVLETIHEAAALVQKAPVGKAFDWGRLVRRGLIAAGLTLGLYLVVGGSFLTYDALRHPRAGRAGFSRFNEVAAIWFERNILLQNTIWPRRAQVEFINFPVKDLHVGKDNKVPPLRVRALEYVIADPKSPEGWRALRWADLRRPDLLAAGAPAEPTALPPRDPAAGLTVDEVALLLRKFDVRTQGDGAAKWQTADAAAPGGWRPLLWSDLTPEKLGGLNPPRPPAAWAPADAAAGLTVADVERAVAAADRAHAPDEVKDADVVLVHLAGLAAAHDALDRVNAAAARPEASRSLRRLELPEVIHLKCVGDKTYLWNELHKGQDNEYTGSFGELKESVAFNVQAEDYWTPRRFITLVPPPNLSALELREERPAYLFYRPDAATPSAFLRGKKQPFEARDVLQAGSETSRIDLPAGSDVALSARADKPLGEAVLKTAKNVDEVRVRVDPAKVRLDDAGVVRFFGAEAPGLRVDAAGEPGVYVVRPTKAGESMRLPLEVTKGKEFRVELPDVRKDLVFEFEFTDTDGVKNHRKVVVKPQDDTAPELTDVQIDTIRKATIKATRPSDHDETYYVVTRKARIPLLAKIHDDHMLGELRYRFTLASSGKSDANAFFLAPSLGLAAPAGASPLQAAVYLLAQDRDADAYVPPQFAATLARSGDSLPSETVRDLLRRPQQPPFRQLVRDVEMKADEVTTAPADAGRRERTAQDNDLGWDFPLWQKMPPLLEDNHPPYRMDLWLEATDTDADELAGPDGKPRPHLSKSKETFSFLIVPESTLLAQIGEDEVKQYASMNKRFQDLQEKAGMLSGGIDALNRPDVQVKDLLAPSTRAEQINEVLENSLATTRDVFNTYGRLVHEEELNVVHMKKITDTQRDILAPLSLIITSDFPAVLDANAKFRKALDDKAASDRDHIDASRAAGVAVKAAMDKLLADLGAVLDKMKGLEGLDTLVQRATVIRDGVHDLAVTADEIKKILEDSFFDDPKK